MELERADAQGSWMVVGEGAVPAVCARYRQLLQAPGIALPLPCSFLPCPLLPRCIRLFRN